MCQDLFAKNGLTLDRLYALVLLQEKGSLIRAADGDPVRQSQMSRYLKELASYFEFELVEQSGKSLKLTAAGNELADMAQRHFREILSFRDQAKNLPKTVSIAAEPHLLASMIAPLIGRVGQSRKGLRFELLAMHAEEMIERLQEQKISLGIFAERNIPRNLQSTALKEQNYGIIIPDRLVPTGGMMTWQRAMSQCPCAWNQSDKRLIRSLNQKSQDTKQEFKPALRCSSQEECVAAVRSGYFASVLPLWVLPSLEGVEIQVMEPPELGALSGQVLAAWNKRHFQIHPHLAGIPDLLQEFLGE